MKHTFIRLLVLFCAGILVVSCREQKKSTPAGVDVKEVTFKEAGLSHRLNLQEHPHDTA